MRCASSLVSVASAGCAAGRRLPLRTHTKRSDLMTALDFYEYHQLKLVDVRQDESNRAMNKHNTINMNEILHSEISFCQDE